MMNIIKQFGLASGLGLILVLTSFAATPKSLGFVADEPIEMQDRQKGKEKPVERDKEEKRDKPRDEGKRDDKPGKKKPDNWTASWI